MDKHDVIVGHKKQIETLKSAIREGKLSHSYLFQGREGIGKKKLASIFAKTLLCKEKGLEPCNKCRSCIKFETNNHPDFSLIEPENEIIKKSQIDKLVEEVSTNPFESDRKIFIIDKADLMNKESMNAILKTLEEPPSFFNIILITSNGKYLLPTIVSRCQDIKFFPIGVKDIMDYLDTSYKLPREKLEFISEFARGSIGFAEALAGSDKLLGLRDEIIGLVGSLIDGKKFRAFTSSNIFEDNREDIDTLLDFLVYWLRDLAVYKETTRLDLVVNRDKKEELSKQSIIEFTRITDIIENVEETRRKIKSNVNFILSIELMLLNIQEES